MAQVAECLLLYGDPGLFLAVAERLPGLRGPLGVERKEACTVTCGSAS